MPSTKKYVTSDMYYPERCKRCDLNKKVFLSFHWAHSAEDLIKKNEINRFLYCLTDTKSENCSHFFVHQAAVISTIFSSDFFRLEVLGIFSDRFMALLSNQYPIKPESKEANRIPILACSI